jgi:hypothetical protein
MRTQVDLMDEKSKVLHHTEIVGGFDIESAVRMALGRTKFEMDRSTDVNWTTAMIVVTRWTV